MNKVFIYNTNNIGGNVSTQRIARSVRNSFDDFDYITTLVDFYGFKNNKCITHEALETEIIRYTKRLFHNVDPSQKFFPYVQMYEFEGLLFSDVSHFDWLDDGWDETKHQQLQEIRDAFQTPEMINNSPHTAPSKRLKHIFQYHYDKIEHGILIAESIGLQAIREACPNFNAWLGMLEGLKK